MNGLKIQSNLNDGVKIYTEGNWMKVVKNTKFQL